MARHRFSTHRTGWVFTALALVSVALSGCFAQSADPPRPSTPSPSSPSPTSAEPDTGPWERPRDGAAVTVQEQGVTATQNYSAGKPMSSWAVVVENPSTDIAVRTVLRITLLDANGKRVDASTDDKGMQDEQHVVNLVMPGERQTITHAWWYEGKVADIEAEVVRNAWRSSWFAGDDDRFVPAKAADVTVHQDGSGDEVASYRVDWPYEQHFGDVNGTVRTYAAFRDAAGNLIGGTHYGEADPRLYQPGDNTGTIDIRNAPDDWDSVEVHVDPWVDVDRLDD